MFRTSIPTQLQLLGRLTGAADTELRSFMRLSTTIDVPAATTLMHEGAPGAEVIVLLSGELAVTRDDELIATVAPGNVVGELAILNNNPRNATVRSTVPSSVAVLSRSEFASVLDSCPVLAKAFLTAAVERLTPQLA